MMETMGRMPRYRVPNNALELTRRRIAEASGQPTRAWLFRIPRWGAVSAASVVIAALLILAGIGLLFDKHETTPIPLGVYVQEHEITGFKMLMPPDLISRVTAAQTEVVSDDIQLEEDSMSRLDMLLEVHYDTYPKIGL
jgi:hypothetical protein